MSCSATILIIDEEIKAVKVLHSALRENPLSYPILHAQCDFLLSKGRPKWAQQVAQQAVNAAPSEFVTWAKLTETYIELEQYDSALLTLNSCPMFTFNERDLHRMPAPKTTHLPVKKFIADSNILDEDSAKDNEADVALLRLPAPGLRGTFAKAYSLLTNLVAKIGWDELLKARSKVFVMEEEYRMHKNKASVELDGIADDTASTTAIHSPPTSATPSDIPTIRISSESTRVKVNGNGHKPDEADDLEQDHPTPDLKETPIEKPEEAHGEVAAEPAAAVKSDTDDAMSAFSNKRLCERWLDNLFL